MYGNRERERDRVQTVRFSGEARPCDGVDGTKGRPWRRCPVAVAAVKTDGGASRRWQCHPRDRTMVSSGVAAGSNIIPWAVGPTSSFMSTVRRSLPTSVGFDAPDQSDDQRPKGQLGRDQPNACIHLNPLFSTTTASVVKKIQFHGKSQDILCFIKFIEMVSICMTLKVIL
jgi:hypothetical protein